MDELFHRFAVKTAKVLGTSWVFVAAISIIGIWLLTGPFFHYSDKWQLYINTGTTIITFLMVFLIQNSQNRDTDAIQLKLDELLRGIKGARTGLVKLEELSDDQLNNLKKQFEKISDPKAIERLQKQSKGRGRQRTANSRH